MPRAIARSDAEIDDLLNHCAALFDAGGDGSLEGVTITSALEWLFGDINEHPLAGLPKPAED